MTDQELTPLEAVRRATAAKVTAVYNAAEADAKYREAIKAAIDAGERVTEIAEAAGGLTPQRIYQIRDGRR